MSNSDKTALTTTSAKQKKVVFVSSLGTIFEWYDFYLYGSLAAIIAKQFFSGLDESAGFIFALLAFAAGFVVRPFGALVFGRLGDMIGRKYTFLVTILLMGMSTFIVGVLPNYATIGIMAPILLILLRLLQGLALGGEYGGAATYVAEYAPENKRGLYTSFIQTTATIGLCLSLVVILGVRTLIGEVAFADWGWRIPFLLSVILLAISVFMRLSMDESPVFNKLKAEKKTSSAPLSDSFGNFKNLKVVIIALFGLTAGQAVVWYTGQFYTLIFLTQYLKVEAATANIFVALSLLIATPGFILFGKLSDKYGRKPIILAGLALAALTYIPVFTALTSAANPELAAAQEKNKVTVTSDVNECSFQFNPTGTSKFTSSCDIAKQILASSSVSYDNIEGAPGSLAVIKIGDKTITSYQSKGLSKDELKVKSDSFRKSVSDALKTAGYPAKANMDNFDKVTVLALLVYLVILVTMVYGPIAAMLVEMFPTRIRYTSMSLPYHLGNGWFGGLLPTTTFAIVAQTGNMYNGLWYPIIVAAATFVIGLIFVKETKNNTLYRDN